MDGLDERDEAGHESAGLPAAQPAPALLALGQWETVAPGATPPGLARRTAQGLLAGAWGEEGLRTRLGEQASAGLWGLLLALGWWLVFRSQPFDKDWSGVITATPVGKAVALLLVVLGFLAGGAAMRACRARRHGLVVSLAALVGLVGGGTFTQVAWRFGPVWFAAIVLTPLLGAGCLYVLAAAVTRRDNASLARLAGVVLGVVAVGLLWRTAPPGMLGPLAAARRPGSPIGVIAVADPVASADASGQPNVTDSPDPQMSVQEATRLGELANPDSIGPLRAAALSRDPKLSQAAVMAIGRIPDVKALDVLIALEFEPGFHAWDALEPAMAICAPRFADRAESDALSSDVTVRRRAMLVLYYTAGPHEVGTVIGLLSDPDALTRSSAAYCLQKIGDPRAVEPLAAATHDPDELVRDRAVSALAKIGGPRAIEALAAAAADPSGANRGDAALALVQAGDSRGLSLVAEMVADGGAGCSSEAIKALGRMPSRLSANALFQRLVAAGVGDNPLVSDALRSMKPEARDVLVAAAVNPDYKVRRRAVPLVREFYPGDRRALAAANRGDAMFDAAALGTALEDCQHGSGVRAEIILRVYRGESTTAMIAVADDALKAPFQRGDREAFEAALHDSNDRVRLAAVTALGHDRSGASSDKQMVEALRDDSRAIRRAALKGLDPQGWIPENERPAVHELLLHDPDPSTRALAAKVLSHLGRSKADLAALTQALNDRNASVREAAQAALHH